MKYYLLSVRRKKIFLSVFILVPLVPFFASLLLTNNHNNLMDFYRYFIFGGFLGAYEWMLEYFTQFDYYGGKKINNFTFFLTSSKGLPTFKKIIYGNTVRRILNYLYYFLLAYLVILYEDDSEKMLQASIVASSFIMMYLFELIMERILISFADVVYLYIFMSFLPILGFSIGSILSLYSMPRRVTTSVIVLIISAFLEIKNNNRIYKKAVVTTKK